MPLAGLVLNRVQEVTLPELSSEAAVAAAERLVETSGNSLTSGLLSLHADRADVTRRQQRMAARFCAAHPSVPIVSAPALAGDVHDLAGLRTISESLTAP